MFPPRLRTRSSPGASKNSLRRAYGHATPGAPAGRSRHIPVAPANEQLQPSPRQSTTRVSRVTRYEPPQPRRACDTQHHPERAATTAPRLRTRNTTPSEPLQPHRACGHAASTAPSEQQHRPPLLRVRRPSRAARKDPAHPRRACERAATPPAASTSEPPQPRRPGGSGTSPPCLRASSNAARSSPNDPRQPHHPG